MDVNNCRLQLLDLYFSKYDFTLYRREQEDNYKTGFNIEYAVNRDDSSDVRVTVNTTVGSAEQSFQLNLQAVGHFKIENAGPEDNVYRQLLKQNTVAIMFPYIRSQISLLTTQPGMKPVIVPPMNIVALLGENG